MLEFLGIAAIAVLMHIVTLEEPKEVVILLAEDDGSTGTVLVSSGDSQVRLDKAGQGTEFGADAPPTETVIYAEDRIAALFGAALSAQPIVPAHFQLYFKHDSNSLTEESSGVLPGILEEIKRRPSPEIVIIGHTDTMGPAQYNQQLGLQRAQLIYDAIVDIGANPSQIRIESHGEANPLIPTADEVLEPKNKRVEVSVR